MKEDSENADAATSTPTYMSNKVHSLIHNTCLLQPAFHLCKLTIGIHVQWNGPSLVTHLIYINIHLQQIILTKIGRTSKTVNIYLHNIT